MSTKVRVSPWPLVRLMTVLVVSNVGWAFGTLWGLMTSLSAVSAWTGFLFWKCRRRTS